MKSASRDILAFNHFDAGEMNLRESLLTLSNTVMGLRGSEDENPSGSMPGLYIAGLFDRSECLVSEIVCFPDPFQTAVAVNGKILDPLATKLDNYTRCLNLRRGVVERELVYSLGDGKKITVNSSRFLSWFDTRTGAMLIEVTANFEGEVSLRTALDASIPSREGAYAYDEKVHHFFPESMSDQYAETFTAKFRMRDRRHAVVYSIHDQLEAGERKVYSRKVKGLVVEGEHVFNIKPGSKVRLVRYFSMQDSRDEREECLEDLAEAGVHRMRLDGFDACLTRSASSLEQLWEDCDVKIEGDDESDRLLKFNVYNLLALGNADSERFAIGAKGLSTEHYGGHYFWDTEVYLLPFFLHARPSVARNLMAFRSRTLHRAVSRAAEEGFRGSLWPWQSDDLGEEGIRQTVLADGRVLRRDILDQYHNISDIAWAALEYLDHTGDEFYFRKSLAPLVIEAMRFWESFLQKVNSPGAEVLHVPAVMGPDEYHPKVDDNYYTNYMTRRVFDRFFDYFDKSSSKVKHDISKWNRLSDAEVLSLKSIYARIYLPAMRDNVIEQFEGFFELKDHVIRERTPKGLPVYPNADVGKGLADTERQDALQEDARKSQLIKQADAILVIAQEPGAFNQLVKEKTWDYYNDRTLQYSSLSPGSCAIVGAMAGRTAEAFKLWNLAAGMDLNDVKSESETGLHTACHGGTWLGVVKGFCGIHAGHQALEIDPHLPAHWTSVRGRVWYRGSRIEITVSHDKVALKFLGGSAPVVNVRGKSVKSSELEAAAVTVSLK